MLVYILKFSVCLAIFLVFYKLFLEKENMHQFKRFYLLGIVFISIIIPFITFTTYIESQNILDNLGTATFSPQETASMVTDNPINYLPMIQWSIYALGVIAFGLKFSVNLAKIILKIKKNPKHKSFSFINVLLQDLVTPHTFFSYIFLNKHKYETHQIPQEVLLHEQTHAVQKHSLDILFVEVLQIIFWFNPLVYFIKNSIKLNHEFLADNAVLNNGIQPTNYQHILLAFSANSSEPHLTNAINYSSIKKRLTVMKTQTSKQKMWLRSLVLLPLLALTLYSFSEHKEVVKEIIPEASINDEATPISNSSTKYTARSIDLEILNDGSYMIDNIKTSKSRLVTVVNTLHQDITPEVRNKIMNIHISSSNEISNKDVWHIYNSLLDYGFYRMVTPTQEIILGKGNTPFAIANIDTSEYLENITNNQEGASRAQIKEYEKLAKYYNALPEKQRIIKLKDVERMKYIYSLMSDKQKKDAEPFPNIVPPPPPPALKAKEIENTLPPPPPPPIPENATKEQKEKYKKVTEEYKRKYTVKDGKVSENLPPPPPPIPENATEPQRKKYEEATRLYKLSSEKLAYQEARLAKLQTEKGELTRVRELKSKKEVEKLKAEKLAYKEAQVAKMATKKRELAHVRELDPPMPPKSPLDHVIEMAKKDAIFYLEGKEVSSDKAIETLKKNNKLNIQTIGSSSQQPKVYITKKPIVIDN